MSTTRSTLKLDTSEFKEMLIQLEGLGGNLKKTVEEAMKPAAEKISADTHAAIQPQFLPAGGKYSKGWTEKSIIDEAVIRWEGTEASMPVGFDLYENPTGSYLITGTPKMQPDKELQKIYKSGKYMRDIQFQMQNVVAEKIVEQMEKS